MPPKSRTIFCRTMPGSPTRMRSVWRPGLSMWSVDLLTAQLRSTLSNHTCEYSTCDEERVANAPSSIWTLYLVSVFVFSPMRKSRSAWSGKVGST